jgi:hypothetical protein
MADLELSDTMKSFVPPPIMQGLEPIALEFDPSKVDDPTCPGQVCSQVRDGVPILHEVVDQPGTYRCGRCNERFRHEPDSKQGYE